MHYANALGLIGYFMATKVFRLMPKEGPMVKVYDTLVLPATKAAEQLVRPAVRPVRLRGGPRSVLTRHPPRSCTLFRHHVQDRGATDHSLIWYVGRITARARVWNVRLKPT